MRFLNQRKVLFLVHTVVLAVFPAARFLRGHWWEPECTACVASAARSWGRGPPKPQGFMDHCFLTDIPGTEEHEPPALSASHAPGTTCRVDPLGTEPSFLLAEEETGTGRAHGASGSWLAPKGRAETRPQICGCPQPTPTLLLSSPESGQVGFNIFVAVKLCKRRAPVYFFHHVLRARHCVNYGKVGGGVVTWSFVLVRGSTTQSFSWNVKNRVARSEVEVKKHSC